MERVNLTPETKITIPVTINNKDIDLSFNIENFAFLENSKKMIEAVARLAQAFEENKTDLKRLDDVRKAVCKDLTECLINICPILKEHLNGVVIDSLTVWIQLLNIIGKYSDKIKVVNRAIAEINKETTGALNG